MLWGAVIAHVLKGNIEEKSLEISMSGTQAKFAMSSGHELEGKKKR